LASGDGQSGHGGAGDQNFTEKVVGHLGVPSGVEDV
jgi:hypothetical protein